MPSSSKKSKGKGKFWQKAILFIGGGAFLGTAMLPIIGGFLSGNNTANDHSPTSTSQTQISTEELEALEENLLVVLEREPNNPNALQNLIRVRLELGDLQGSIDPLDKLITLFPEDQVLKDLKAQIETNIVRTGSTAPAAGDAPPTPESEESAATDEPETEVSPEPVPEPEEPTAE